MTGNLIAAGRSADAVDAGPGLVRRTYRDGRPAAREALGMNALLAQGFRVDHGLTGTNRERPGLREALAAVRAGDTLVVANLDRIARSLPDARDIADELTRKGVALSLGGSVYDPTDPVSRLLFNVLGMVAKFESDLMNPTGMRI